MSEADSKNPCQKLSRRNFTKAAALTVGASPFLSAFTMESALAQSKPGNLPLSMAGYVTDRVRALIDGRVKIEGYDIQYEEAAIGDINAHLFSGPQTYDVAEIGLQPYLLAFADNDFRDYSLLPVFPLRLFRHKSVFIRTDRGIKKGEDLKGKTIGTAGYASTSLTWMRGIFEDEYGVSPEDVQWVISSKNSAADLSGKTSKEESAFPDGLSIRMGPPGKDESDLLESGEVDALFHAVEPRAYLEGHPMVARLFPDYRSTERDYFSRTGVFPIMHAVAIRKSLARENPWLIEAAFNAYSQSKKMAYAYMAKAAWAKDSLPWFGQEFAETRALMGDNYYSYGIEPNRKTLELLFRYSYRQGLCSRELTIEELFEPASLQLIES
jgi:4,5-dihydroxyphthalate decarboxylase